MPGIADAPRLQPLTLAAAVGILAAITMSPGRLAAQDRRHDNPYKLELRPPMQLALGAGWADPGCDCDLSANVLVRALALWREGNSRLGFVGHHAQFPWRAGATSRHTFLGALGRVYSETGPWEVHLGLALGLAHSPGDVGCSGAPAWFAAEPAVGFAMWAAPRWAVGVTAAYSVPLLGGISTCDGGSGGGDRQQVYGVGSVALEITWGASAPRPP